MTSYSIESRVKGYAFWSFAKYMNEDIGKNIRKTLSGKKAKKLLFMLNNPLQMHLKLLQKTFQKNQKPLMI